MKCLSISSVLVLVLALSLTQALVATSESPIAAENEVPSQQDSAYYNVVLVMIEQDGIEPPKMTTTPRLTVIDGQPGVLSLKDEKRSLKFIFVVNSTNPAEFELENFPGTNLDRVDFANPEELLEAIGEARRENQ